MSYWLKQSTAATIKFGPFLDDTDGKTAETALTIAQADIRLSKNGGDIAQTNNATGGTHDELGFYDIPLDTTDTNTLGSLLVAVHESGALPVFQYFMVVEGDAYDALFAAAGTGHIEADAVQVSGDATAANNAESFFDGTGYAGTNNVIPTVTTLTGHTAQTGDNFARLGAPAGASVSADVAAVKVDTAAILVDTGTTLDAALAVVDANVDAILTDTGTTLPATLTTIEGKIDTVDTNVDAVLVDTGTTLDAALAVVDANVDSILTDTGTTLPATLTTIEGKIDTADAVADGIFEILTSAGGTATSNGAADGSTLIDSNQTGANDLYNALAIKITSGLYNGQVRTIKDWDLASTTFTLTRGFGGQIVTGVTYRVVSSTVYQPGITLVPSSAPTVEPDTLETISIAITTNGGAPSTGEITPGTITIARIRAGASTNIVVAAACSEAAGNIYYAYTFPAASWQAGDYYLATMSGQEIQVNGITYPLSTIPFQGYVTREASIVSDIATVDANVDSILTDTGTTLPATLTTIEGKIDTVDTVADAVLVDTGTTLPATLTTIEGKVDTVDTVADAVLVDTGTTIPALIAALENISAAEVNAELVDVVSTDTQTLPAQGAPTATPTIAYMLTWLYKLSRNKIIQNATTLEVYDDAGSTVDHKSTVADDGTDFTRGELVSGP